MTGAEIRCNPEPGERIEFDEPGHFICSDRCEWFAHTHVPGFCISSVGEFRSKPGAPLDEVGHGRLYETYVFAWDPDLRDGKGDNASWGELDGIGSNDLDTAIANHEGAVAKWSARSWHRGETDVRGERAIIPDQTWSR